MRSLLMVALLALATTSVAARSVEQQAALHSDLTASVELTADYALVRARRGGLGSAVVQFLPVPASLATPGLSQRHGDGVWLPLPLGVHAH